MFDWNPFMSIGALSDSSGSPENFLTNRFIRKSGLDCMPLFSIDYHISFIMNDTLYYFLYQSKVRSESGPFLRTNYKIKYKHSNLQS